MIRCADINDLYAAAELAALLWRGSTTEELADEFRPLLATGRARIFCSTRAVFPSDLPSASYGMIMWREQIPAL